MLQILRIIIVFSATNNFQGPVSVAVYAEEQDLSVALWSIAGLRSCHSAVRQNVSFHLVSPLSSATGGGARSPPLPPPPGDTDPCGDRRKHADGTGNYAGGVGRYPNNLLRNVARRGALTEFVLVADVDMVPSENLRKVRPRQTVKESDMVYYFDNEQCL